MVAGMYKQFKKMWSLISTKLIKLKRDEEDYEKGNIYDWN